MIGELMTEQMQSYIRPVPVFVKVSDYVELNFFGEVSIELNFNGQCVSALVPIRTFNKESMTVLGSAIGENPETTSVLVTFAPTQDGQATIEVPSEWLTKASG